MSATDTLPRFARKDIRDFAHWLVDHNWEYTGDDTNGHAQFRYGPTGETHSLPNTPRSFSIQGNRKRCLRKMGQEPQGKRQSKDYAPKKATPQQALTHGQLERLCEVIDGKFREFVRESYKDGKPTYASRVLDHLRKQLIDAVREHA